MSKGTRGAWQTKLDSELAASEQVSERDIVKVRMKPVKFLLVFG